MTTKSPLSAALATLIKEQAVTQLRTRRGQMARLGRDEQGTLKLGWVEVVPQLLKQPDLLENVEKEARAIWQHGIRHIVWSGMGGSVRTVEMLVEMGFCQEPGGITLYPLQSTDPAALNDVVRAIARAKHLTLPLDRPLDGGEKRQLFEDVLLIAVAMSKTSEEPLSHTMWFLNMLGHAHLAPEKHVLVLPLGQSLLAQLARERDLPTLPLFLTGRQCVGRMSAPGSRTFLLPVALSFAHQQEGGFLAAILRQAWDWYDFALAEAHPDQHVFVQLACALFQASEQGACRLLLDLPDAWQPFLPWVEQLLEQSLGKSGKGIVVFRPQQLNSDGPGYQQANLLRVRVTAHSAGEQSGYILSQPYLLPSSDSQTRLAAIAASCLSWQLTMALYAYLADISYSTEPAVERYKALSRTLRERADPLTGLLDPALLALEKEQQDHQEAGTIFAQALSTAVTHRAIQYLDITFNGEPSLALSQMIAHHATLLGNELVGVPVKFRVAPASYHLSEQCQLDGPPLVSLRLLIRDHPAAVMGSYHARYLRAQAVATWLAMREAGRPCFLLLVDAASAPGGASEALDRFFKQVCWQVGVIFAEERRLIHASQPS